MGEKKNKETERQRQGCRGGNTYVRIVRVSGIWNLTFGVISHVIILPRFSFSRNTGRGCRCDITNFHDVVDSLQHRSYLAMLLRYLAARYVPYTTDRLHKPRNITCYWLLTNSAIPVYSSIYRDEISWICNINAIMQVGLLAKHLKPNVNNHKFWRCLSLIV